MTRRMHYVEYLVSAVAKANIDPLPILDLTDCVQELRRRGIPLPERGPWDTDEIYRGMCQKVRYILVISLKIVVICPSNVLLLLIRQLPLEKISKYTQTH